MKYLSRSAARAAATAAWFAAAAGVGALCLLAPQRADAQTVVINHSRQYLNPSSPGSPDPNNIIDLFFDPSFHDFAGGGFETTDYVGAQSVTLSGPNGAIGPVSAYCVDLPGAVGSTPYSAILSPTSALSTGNPAVPGSVLGGGVDWLLTNSVVNTDIDSAGLQLAIWKAEYDWDGNLFSSLSQEPALSLFAGNLQYNTMPFADINTQVDVIVAAEDFLGNWGGRVSNSALLLNTSEVSSPNPGDPPTLRQDLIARIPATAPEPGSAALLIAFLPTLGAGCAFSRRRRITV